MQSRELQTTVAPNHAMHAIDDDDFCCPICLDSFDDTNPNTNSDHPVCGSFNCGHKLCSGCLTKFLTYRIVRENDAFPTCHLAFCDSVASNRLLQRYVPFDVFRLAQKSQESARVRGPDGRPLFCQNIACIDRGIQPLQAPPLSRVGEAAYITRCPECETETCVRCGAAAHCGEQCKRNRNNMLRGNLFRTASMNGTSGNSFWSRAHFAFCSRCLSTTHFDDATEMVTCCGEEVVVIRTQGDFYRYFRKLSWRLFLLYTFRSEFLVRFAFVQTINIWLAFWIITWHRPLLFILSLIFSPNLIARLYNFTCHGFDMAFNYLKHLSAEAPTSSTDSLSSINSFSSIEIEIDL